METNKEVKELKKRLSRSKFKPIESPVKKFWTTKDGEKISYKEFMERWKEGLRGVTPYQQTKMQLKSTFIILIGISCGFIITLFNLKNLWWLSIILGASFFNVLISALGLWQKKDLMENIERNSINIKEIINKI